MNDPVFPFSLAVAPVYGAGVVFHLIVFSLISQRNVPAMQPASYLTSVGMRG